MPGTNCRSKISSTAVWNSSKPGSIDGQAHGPVERADERREPITAGSRGQQLDGLISTDEQLRAKLQQQGDEAVGLGVVKGHRRRRADWYARFAGLWRRQRVST